MMSNATTYRIRRRGEHTPAPPAPRSGNHARTTPFWLACACCALLTAGASAAANDQADAPNDASVSVTDYGVVDINVQNTSLTSVLEMLAYDSRKNIIVGRNVDGNVSVNLFDVTFEEALQAILEPNGYAYMEEGNFIYVMTKQEIRQIEESRRETESRIFELEYLSANDAREFVTPLLSEVGQISNRGDVEPGIRSDLGDVGADNYAYNAKLVINDYVEVLERVEELLEDLDTPPKQVLVEATILQTALDEANAYGVDFSVIGSMDFTNLASPLSGVNNLLGGRDADSGFQPADNRATGVTSSPGNTGGPGTFKVGVIRNDFSVFLKLLDEVTDTTVLARPRIMALNRQRAEVLVGARVGYLSTTATETSSTQTVEFLDTGIQLIFRPFISQDGSIRMELAPRVSEASLRTVTDAQGLQVTIPDELTNELTTNVRVNDGQTLVLGGLFREETRITRRQVPFLGDVPVLGAAFRGQDDNVSRNEIIFLITPSIVHDQTLAEIGKDMAEFVEQAQVGARAGLLPFSRSTISRNYNQKAMDAYKEGDIDRALYHARNSLRLHPTQPEMVRFREELSGEKQRPYERSMIEKVYRDHIGPQWNRNSAGSMNQSRRGDDETAGDASDSSASTSGSSRTPEQRAALIDAILGPAHDEADSDDAPDSVTFDYPGTDEPDDTTDVPAERFALRDETEGFDEEAGVEPDEGSEDDPDDEPSEPADDPVTEFVLRNESDDWAGDDEEDESAGGGPDEGPDAPVLVDDADSEHEVDFLDPVWNADRFADADDSTETPDDEGDQQTADAGTGDEADDSTRNVSSRPLTMVHALWEGLRLLRGSDHLPGEDGRVVGVDTNDSPDQ